MLPRLGMSYNLSDTGSDQNDTDISVSDGQYGPPSTSGLPNIAIHFIVVGALFVLVLLLGLANVYIHYYDSKDGGRGGKRGHAGSRLGAGYRDNSKTEYKKSKTSVTIKMKPTRV